MWFPANYGPQILPRARNTSLLGGTDVIAMNTIGTLYRLTTFGESHGVAIGGVIDGMPAGVPIDVSFIQHQLNRRKPGGSLVSPRQEPDEIHILSGVFEGKSIGTPIGFYVENKDIRSADYKRVFRPSHADATYHSKYGGNWDYRGGGRASGRTTLSVVVGGAFAHLALRHIVPGLNFSVCISKIGNETQDFERAIRSAKESRDTISSEVMCMVTGVPPCLGEPVFNKMQSELSKAMFSIPGVKGFEYGTGFTPCIGSEVADEYGRDCAPKTNHSGGIQGGITNGKYINFKVAFKPIATLPNRTMDMVSVSGDNLETERISVEGRHDVCIAPRAVPIVEALVNMVMLDLYKQQKSNIVIR